MTAFDERLRTQLQKHEQLGLKRSRPLLQSPQTVEVELDGRRFLSFASNDYLGLANDHRVVDAAAKALKSSGMGGGASHLVCGHHYEHELLEQELAAFTGRDRALVFSSGYMANLAVVSTLAKAKSLVLEDKLNHASLIDGARLSGARFQRYLHNDHESLQRYLNKFSNDGELVGTTFDEALVVTDGVFSMDGDVANLAELASVSAEYDAVLVVDDAHGIGVLGEQGRGSVAAAGLSQTQAPVLIGTFGKAFGTAGAFVAGSASLIDYLEQFARPYIYTTSMPPSVAAATRQSLSIIESDALLREKLHENIAYFKRVASRYGMALMPSDTAIQPLMLGESSLCMQVAQALKEQGILVGAIRPPTVPPKQARLRMTLSAKHSRPMIDELFKKLDAVLKTQGSGLSS